MSHESRVFRLAPMSGMIRVVTAAILPLPALILAFGLLGPKAVLPSLLAGSAIVCGLWVCVWCWFRPTRFEVGPNGMLIVWPWRQRLVKRDEIAGAVEMSNRDFLAQYGRGARVGAGGLWGGFGLLMTKKETLDLYASRADRFVLVHRRQGRTMLLTPERPEQFVDAVRAQVG